jgi:hypothetical protein
VMTSFSSSINCRKSVSSCVELTANVMRTKGGRRMVSFVIAGLALYTVVCFYRKLQARIFCAFSFDQLLMLLNFGFGSCLRAAR